MNLGSWQIQRHRNERQLFESKHLTQKGDVFYIDCPYLVVSTSPVYSIHNYLVCRILFIVS